MNCPSCDRLLYSRIQPKCGHCGAVLPPEVRLPDHEIDEIRQEQKEMAQRRAVARAKEEEEREEQRRRSGGDSPPIPPTFMF